MYKTIQERLKEQQEKTRAWALGDDSIVFPDNEEWRMEWERANGSYKGTLVIMQRKKQK